MRYVRDGEEETPALRRLRWLVMSLMVVLMVSIVAIAATIVIRLGFGGASIPAKAERFALPAGEVVGMGQGVGTVMFLVRGGDGVQRLYVFDADTGGAPVSVSIVERD